MKKIKFLKNAEREISLVIGFVLMVAIFSAINPIYLSFSNLKDIVDQATIFGIIAIGMTFVIITGGIDLSVGSTLALTGVLIAEMLVAGAHPALAVFAGILAGVVIGLFNGLLVTKMKLQPFIATLGTMSLFRGVAYIFTKGLPVTNLPGDFRKMIYGELFYGIRGSIILMLLFAVFAHILLRYTRFGSYIYAMGGNEEATRLSGVNIAFNKVLAYVVCAVGTVLAAIVLTAKLGAAESTAGQGFELNAIAAAAIGGTSLAGGKGTIMGTFIGALLFSGLRIGLIVVGVDAFWQYVATGLVIIVAAYVEVIQSKFNLASVVKRNVNN